MCRIFIPIKHFFEIYIFESFYCNRIQSSLPVQKVFLSSPEIEKGTVWGDSQKHFEEESKETSKSIHQRHVHSKFFLNLKIKFSNFIAKIMKFCKG